jgi:glucokinase
MILGLDVGESGVAAVLVDAEGTTLRRAARATATTVDVTETVRELGDDAPRRMGIAFSEGAIATAADVAAAAAAAFDTPVDTRIVARGPAFALGEHWRGAAQGSRHVVALTAGETIHAGILVDGRVFAGAHGFAGAAGWLSLNPVERDDYRKLGCLEAEVGSAGIVRRLVWRVRSGDTSRVVDMAGGQLSDVRMHHVLDAAREGDGVAVAVVRDTARYIGMAIGNLVAIVDPEVVVLGGLIAAAGDLLVELSRVEATRRMSNNVSATVRILAGTLGDDAAAIGAARAAMIGP